MRINMRMKIREILPESKELDEVRMSPSSLRAAASKVEGALVGIEFEMYVPNAEGGEREPEYEPDWDMDGYISTDTWQSFENDIVNFFTGGEFSDYSRTELKRLVNGDVREEFNDWVETAWRDHADDNFDEWYEEDNPGEDPPAPGTRGYERAMDEFRESRFDDWFSSEDVINKWLESERIDRYRNFADRYDLNWPYMMDINDSSDGMALDDVADAFSRAVGMPCDWSKEYHGKKQRPGHYVVEPDGSLDSPDSNEDAGLEFKSPELPLDKILDQVEKVRAWMDKAGAYTNSTTGLHINVSVPGYSIENLDYIKLALFLGDDWVAEQFGRLGNQYARSSMSDIQTRISRQSSGIDGIKVMMKAIKSGMAKIASKIIHSGDTEKRITINTKSNRVEFRAPGNDWFNDDISKVINSIYRFIVALDIAMDPEKERKEYAKKFYALLSDAMPESEQDSIKMFVRYSAGLLPTAALKSFVRDIQKKRIDSKKSELSGEKFMIVDRHGKPIESDFRGLPLEPFMADSLDDARNRLNDMIRTGQLMPDVSVVPVDPNHGTGYNLFKIDYVNRQTGQRGSIELGGNSRRAVVQHFDNMMPGYEITRFTQIS